MDGFSSHTFKWVNAKGDVHFVKYHFKTDQGIENFTDDEANELVGKNADYAIEDLFKNIEEGKFPSWTLYM